MKAKKTQAKGANGFAKNAELDKYAHKVLFKNKVAKANTILKTVGLPKTDIIH